MINLFMRVKSLKEYKKLFIASSYLLIFVMTLFIVSATNYQEALNWWSNSRVTEVNTDSSHIPVDFREIYSEDSINYGNTISPIVADLDGDNVTELYLSAGNYLWVYRINDESQLELVTQQSTYFTATYSGATLLDTISGKWEWALPHGRTLSFFTYNGTQFNESRIHNNSLVGDYITSPILCSSAFSATYGNVCWYSSYNNFYQYYASNRSSNYLILPSQCYTTAGVNPDIAFTNNFNGNKLALSCPQALRFYIINPLIMNIQNNINTGKYPHRLFFWNADGGHDELYMALQTSGGNPSSTIRKYDSSITLKDTMNYVCSGDKGGQPNIQMAAGAFTENDYQIALTSSHSGCIKIIDAENLSSIKYNVAMNDRPTGNIFSSDLDNDGFDELITSNHIYDFNDNNFINFTNPSDTDYMVMGDISNDGLAEIIGSFSGKTWVATSYPVIYSITTNGRQPDRSWANPVCVGSTVTFSVGDCYAYDSDNCNYLINNNNTREFLYSTCGQPGENYYLGSLNGAKPSIDCYFNQTKNYDVRIFLASEVTLDTIPYYDLTINVINGTTGFTCNLGSYTPVIPSGGIEEPVLTEEDMNFIVNTLTGGGSQFVKLLLLMAFTIGIIAFFASRGIQNPIIYVIGIFCLWLVMAMIGFVSYIFVVLLTFVIGLASAIMFIKGK